MAQYQTNIKPNSESSGIAKDGAKMVTSVARSEVPKFTVIIGGLVQVIMVCAVVHMTRDFYGYGQMREFR